MRFFSLDSSFHKYGTILFDMMVLGFFWFFISFGTLGLLMPTATAGVFNSINHVMIKEDGYLLRSFFGVFKGKVLRNIGLSLTSALFLGFASFNIWSVASGVVDMPYLIGLYVVIFLEVVVTMVFASALLAESDMTLTRLIKYGFLLANKHFLVALATIGTFVLMAALVLLTGNLLFFFLGMIPALWFIAWMIYTKVFEHYHLDKLV